MIFLSLSQYIVAKTQNLLERLGRWTWITSKSCTMLLVHSEIKNTILSLCINFVQSGQRMHNNGRRISCSMLC